MAGVVILAGHYIDFFNMIMPGTVGEMVYWCFRNCFSSFFLGLFIYVVFTALTKNPLLPKEIHSLKRVNIFIINI
jgi:hypothetical protein